MRNILLYTAILFFNVSGIAQFTFKPIEKGVLDSLIEDAIRNNEIDRAQMKKLDGEYQDMIAAPKNANAVFDYGRILTALLQPGLASATTKALSEGGRKIVGEAEDAYRNAISHCECHGRANIMLGLLYNQQGKYFLSEPHLEKGLKLDEGGEDWMVAANQYLLAGAYTYNTENEKYLKVYDLFKKYAKSVTKEAAYYQKMAGLYVAYYEK
ncbi:hypothetical protein D1818_15035 [Aquimarina sp. BL5]|uniref:hypothetical protein n=1 Tax=Aquimarina sp. BL5 TaxID=1714860 RepID=UPI000E48B541|nr:hypothetical protein [Aquimarina sp. BL5]AXT52089.1 hypothetical protein D1818_15035 [Aquimarina sp. BL5]RKN05167.1 hypothetical protein D7036_11015 [Aquimarina sp. BL5]